jgi:hypothetical protein
MVFRLQGNVKRIKMSRQCLKGVLRHLSDPLRQDDTIIVFNPSKGKKKASDSRTRGRESEAALVYAFQGDTEIIRAKTPEDKGRGIKNASAAPLAEATQEVRHPSGGLIVEWAGAEGKEKNRDHDLSAWPRPASYPPLTEAES